MLLFFSQSLQDIFQQKTYSYLNHMSTVFSKTFTNTLKNQTKILEIAAKNFEEQEFIRLNTTPVLQIIRDSGSFDSVSISTANGDCVTSDSEVYDISNDDYFRQAIKGSPSISDVFISKSLRTPSFIISVPIFEEGKPVGTLQGLYSLVSANKFFLSSFYEEEYYGYIVAGNGDIILKSQTQKALSSVKNIFDFFENANYNNTYSYEQMLVDFAEKTTTTFEVEYKGNKRYACIMPLGVNGWYVLSFCTEDLLNNDINTFKTIYLVFAIFIVALAGIIFAYIFKQIKISQNKITALKTRYQSLLNNMSNGVLTYGSSSLLSDIVPDFVNAGFEKLTGYTLKDLKELQDGRFVNLIYYLDVYSTEKDMQFMDTGELVPMQYRIVHRNGDIIWVLETGYTFTDVDGKEKVQSTLTDITDLKESETALKVSEERFRVALSHINENLFDDMIEADLTADEVFTVALNSELSTQCLIDSEYKYSTFVKSFANRVIHEDYCSEYKHMFSTKHILALHRHGLQSFEYEFKMRCANDSNAYTWIKTSACFYYSEVTGAVRLISYLKNIDAQKQQLERLVYKSQTDSLTGLYNKASTTELITEAIRSASGCLNAFLLIDIDNFKGINDTLGHMYGDKVLTGISKKLLRLFRNTDIIGRIGGDEFVTFLTNVKDEKMVKAKAEEMKTIFRENYIGDDNKYKVSCSIGIAFSGDGDTFDTLYRKADIALYKAKHLGKDNYQIFNE